MNSKEDVHVSREYTRSNDAHYLEAHDENRLDYYAIFSMITMGDEIRGREAIGKCVHAFDYEIFDAEVRLNDLLIAMDQVGFAEGRASRQFRCLHSTLKSGAEVLDGCPQYVTENL